MTPTILWTKTAGHGWLNIGILPPYWYIDFSVKFLYLQNALVLEIMEKFTKGKTLRHESLLITFSEWRGQTVAVKRLLCQKVDQVDMCEIKQQLKEIALMR